MPELTLYEALAGLFTSAFVSATLFPGASETVLLALVHAWPDEITAAVAVATIGNTLGSMTSYLIGRLFPKKVSGKAIDWLTRWGVWALLFAWLPIVGDTLPLAAGWLRISWLKSFFIYSYRQGCPLCSLSLWICSTFLTKLHRNTSPDAI